MFVMLSLLARTPRCLTAKPHGAFFSAFSRCPGLAYYVCRPSAGNAALFLVSVFLKTNQHGAFFRAFSRRPCSTFDERTHGFKARLFSEWLVAAISGPSKHSEKRRASSAGGGRTRSAEPSREKPSMLLGLHGHIVCGNNPSSTE